MMVPCLLRITAQNSSWLSGIFAVILIITKRTNRRGNQSRLCHLIELQKVSRGTNRFPFATRVKYLKQSILCILMLL